MVIPTTPNTAVLPHQQLHDHISNAYIANHSIRSNQTPETFSESSVLRVYPVDANQQHTPQQSHQSNHQQQHHPQISISAANIEDRLNQIQEYIRITSSLINSIQDKVN